jgi:hypothetical protein
MGTVTLHLPSPVWAQNQRMRTPYIPVMHCEKMAVTAMTFRQRVVIEFLVKEVSSAGFISERLRGVYEDVCMGTSSVRTG